MKQEFLKNYDMLYLNILALIIFLTVFFGVIATTFSKKSKLTYMEIERLPIDQQGGH